MTADQPDVDLTAAGPFVAAMKFEVTEAGGSRVTGHVDLGPDQHTPWGVVHGGLYCSVVESAASIGASTAVLEHGQFAVGVNNNTDFLRAISSGTVTAVSTPIHRGRRQQLWLITITDDNDRVVARGQVRLQNISPE